MNKNKSILGVISIFLWTTIIIIAARLYIEKTGTSLPISNIILLVCIVAFFVWWMYTGTRFRRFTKKFDEAGFKYFITQDIETYITELDECSKMPGVEKFTLSGMPAKHYIAMLKIMNLRTAGRIEEANTLLETIGKEITNKRAQQLWEAEKKRLQ